MHSVVLAILTYMLEMWGCYSSVAEDLSFGDVNFYNVGGCWCFESWGAFMFGVKQSKKI